jgi:DNA-binding LytR/AlgR family response regulator
MIRAIPLENSPQVRKSKQSRSIIESRLDMVRELHSVKPKVEALGRQQVFDRDDFILVKNEYKMINLQVKDLIYIEGKGNYVSLFTTKSKILTLQTMKNLESFLLPYLFVRVHKSFLVSFHHVEAIDNNTIWIRNMEIPIGDSYRESLKAFLNANTKQI